MSYFGIHLVVLGSFRILKIFYRFFQFGVGSVVTLTVLILVPDFVKGCRNG